MRQLSSCQKSLRFIIYCTAYGTERLFSLVLTCSPDDGHVVPSGKVVFSQAKVPVRDPMASTKPMLNILTVYLTLHKARLTVTVLITGFPSLSFVSTVFIF
jgi:hypothetical protein